MLGILAGISVPAVLGGVDRARGLGAVRHLAGRMALARARAVSQSVVVALRFETDARGVFFTVVEDGNRDGVRARDVALGLDPVIEGPVHLGDLYPGARIALAPDMPGGDAVRIGSGDILSFTPEGTASSGSIYVLGPDGTQWVVRVLGVTARARVLRRVPGTDEWVHAF